MRSLFAPAFALFLFGICPGQSALSAEPQAGPAEKRPAVKDLNTPREFPNDCITGGMAGTGQRDSRAGARQLRSVADAGEDTAPAARIFGKIEREGYSVEKVYFQPLPGFYLGGNLYRPLGRGKGPFPAILNPHGHWKEGRLADNKDGSTRGTLHQLCAPGHDRVFLRHGRL